MQFKKIWLFISSLCFLFSCHEDHSSDLLGEWKVPSPYYSAKYQILEDDDELHVLVLSYDDGTSRYSSNGKQKRYAYQSLNKKAHKYVDAISGASTKASEQHTVELQPKGRDTLEITTFFMDRPLKEFWVRTSKNKNTSI